MNNFFQPIRTRQFALKQLNIKLFSNVCIDYGRQKINPGLFTSFLTNNDTRSFYEQCRSRSDSHNVQSDL